jgi:hypothetical protein
MPCSKCQQDPKIHNFQILGKSSQGSTLLYSKPFDATEKEFTEESIASHYAHFDEIQGPWVWLFDATDLHKLKTPNITLIRSLYAGIEERYKTTLKCIYILHPNWRLESILGMIRPFMKKEAKQRLVENPSALELVGMGIDAALVKSLLRCG